MANELETGFVGFVGFGSQNNSSRAVGKDTFSWGFRSLGLFGALSLRAKGNPKARRTHNMRLLGPKTILY